ncbi:MAG: fused MFS/spermidine synthase [Verrucomicrobiae bacterium]|nr:fused MFS/spermidine synthase [Verrucomicrobiae bacterium]
MIALSAITMLSLATATPENAETQTAAAEPVTWRQRAAWIGLSFVPSGLLVAVTTHISTDIASMPLLWVIPLAVYLITFMLAFRETPIIPDRWLSIASAPLVAATIVVSLIPSSSMPAIHFGLVSVSFIVLVVMNHRELYRRRPGVSRLTEFYLWMSFGGVLGGMACSLLAPQIFNSVLEYPLLLVTALAGQSAFLSPATPEQRELRKGFLIVTVTLLVVSIVGSAVSPGTIKSTTLLGIFTFVGVLGAIALCTKPKLAIIPCAAMVAALAVFPKHATPVTQQRSFFGVVAVHDVNDKRLMLLGTTIHGAEKIASADGTPYKRPPPITYYHPDNAMPKGLDIARATAADPQALRVGIVGLGVGAMACNGRPGERWRFYEIDKLVVDIASDPRYFSYLSKCPVSDGVKLGDARLTVQQEPKASFDYLLIDAFSSDVVPAHLMTLEAITMYLERLKPNGVLALHVSSRILDLEDVAAATAGVINGVHIVVVKTKDPTVGDPLDKTGSKVVFVTRNADAARRLQDLIGVTAARPEGITPWTDDYSDILGSIIRFQQKLAHH